MSLSGMVEQGELRSATAVLVSLATPVALVGTLPLVLPVESMLLVVVEGVLGIMRLEQAGNLAVVDLEGIRTLARPGQLASLEEQVWVVEVLVEGVIPLRGLTASPHRGSQVLAALVVVSRRIMRLG